MSKYDIEQEKTENFLEELSALSRKHQIAIEGCGCCGSPFLMKTGLTGEYTGNSSHIMWCGAASEEELAEIRDKNKQEELERRKRLGLDA